MYDYTDRQIYPPTYPACTTCLWSQNQFFFSCLHTWETKQRHMNQVELERADLISDKSLYVCCSGWFPHFLHYRLTLWLSVRVCVASFVSLCQYLVSLSRGEVLELQRLLGNKCHSQMEVVIPQLQKRDGERWKSRKINVSVLSKMYLYAIFFVLTCFLVGNSFSDHIIWLLYLGQ